MARLQRLVNKRQKKEAYTLSVPLDIVRLLKLKKGQEFAVRFDENRKSIEYVPVRP